LFGRLFVLREQRRVAREGRSGGEVAQHVPIGRDGADDAQFGAVAIEQEQSVQGGPRYIFRA
jgi:hypothetical protein